MKIELYDTAGVVVVDEDFNGVTTFNTPHSGKIRVESISDVFFAEAGETLRIICKFRGTEEGIRVKPITADYSDGVDGAYHYVDGK